MHRTICNIRNEKAFSSPIVCVCSIEYYILYLHYIKGSPTLISSISAI